MIQILIFIAFVFFPVYVVFLNIIFGWEYIRGFVSSLLIVHALYRTWETFYTSRDRRRLQLHGDWTLALSTFIYVLYHFLFVTEFFFIKRPSNIVALMLGLILYLVALRLRIWGEIALGSQWSIHAVGAKKIRKVKLLRLGPYRYIRHPIYLGIMIESLSLSLVTTTFYSLCFAVLVFVPVMMCRVFMEEESSLRRFGEEKYQRYKSQTNMFIPLGVVFKKGKT